MNLVIKMGLGDSYIMNSRCQEPSELWLRWGQGIHLMNSRCWENEPDE